MASGTLPRMDSELRVALAGYGLAGRVFHAPLVSAADGLALTHVATSAPERVAQVRADLPAVPDRRRRRTRC